MTETTEDTFFEGRIRVRQHRDGYRFSIDAIILAQHAAGAGPVPEGGGAPNRNPRPRHVLDLGTGCGIIPLILAIKRPRDRITGVEVQEELARLARDNARENGMADRIAVLHRDLKDVTPDEIGGTVDLVVSNPPYRAPGSGRMNRLGQRAVARHEILAALPDVVGAASRMLGISGRFAVIFPAERLPALLSEMRAARIEPKFLRMVHSRRETWARLALVEGIKGGRPGLAVAPALVIYREDGGYTDEAAGMFQS